MSIIKIPEDLEYAEIDTIIQILENEVDFLETLLTMYGKLRKDQNMIYIISKKNRKKRIKGIIEKLYSFMNKKPVNWGDKVK